MTPSTRSITRESHMCTNDPLRDPLLDWTLRENEESCQGRCQHKMSLGVVTHVPSLLVDVGRAGLEELLTRLDRCVC